MKKCLIATGKRFGGMFCLAISVSSTAMALPPVVSVVGQHYGGKVLYQYRLINNGPYEISSVLIGYDSLNDNNHYTGVWELNELPSGLTDDLKIPPASVTSPPGWEATLINPEETPTHAINWEVADANSPRLPLGQTLSGMRITLDKIDNSHVTGHATIHFSNRPSTDDVTVPMQRIDTTPPSLTVSLSPNKVWPPNDKMVSVTAAITVKDNYDPAPEIKLESITANETLAANDIQGAQFGIDDRQFSLVAKRAGTNLAGRIYTITYSATDASGNRATASATVTVPHDQGK